MYPSCSCCDNLANHLLKCARFGPADDFPPCSKGVCILLAILGQIVQDQNMNAMVQVFRWALQLFSSPKNVQKNRVLT